MSTPVRGFVATGTSVSRRSVYGLTLASTALLTLTACGSTPTNATNSSATRPSTSLVATAIASPSATPKKAPTHAVKQSRKPSPAKALATATPRPSVAPSPVVVTSHPAAPVSKGPCRPTPAPTTPIYPSTSKQVIVTQRTNGTFGTFNRYQWVASACRWENYGSATGVFGQNGVVPASQRVQGSNATPAGTFPLIQAFGIHNPGTRMPYTTLTTSDWWDERPSSATYNELLTTGPHGCNLNDCEQLIRDTDAYGSQLYDQAVFIGYNLPGPNQKRSGGGSGAGIFLHFAHEYTGGCVAVNDLTELTDTVAWLNPAEHPLIVIRG